MNIPVSLEYPDSQDLVRGRSRAFEILWHFLGSPILKTELLPLPSIKRAILRLFGARVGRKVILKPGIKVKFPWYLSIGDYAWVGERAWIDNLANVSIGAHACISQDVYLCTGNHDWSSSNMRLYCRPVSIGAGAWVAARSSVFPGVTVGTCAVVVGGSIVAKDVPPYEIHGGNPACLIRVRTIRSKNVGAPQPTSAEI